MKKYYYLNGELHGKYVKYNESGIKLKKLNYNHGKLHGECKYYEHLTIKVELYDNGNLLKSV